MLKKVTVALIAIAVATAVLIIGGSYGKSCMGSSATFAPGIKALEREVLTYKVDSWLGHSGDISIETGELHTLADGRKAYRMTYSIKTSPRASKLYSINGRINVLLDAETLLPIQYEESVRAGLGIWGGGKLEHKKLVYNRRENLLLSYKTLNTDGVPGKGRRIPPDSHHFTTLVCSFKDAELSVGQRLSFTLADRKKDSVLRATVARKENYMSHLGVTRTAYVVQTTTDFGNDSIKGAKFDIWLDCEGHYPVRIDAHTKWGKITATLTGRTVLKDPSENENSGNYTSTSEGNAASGKTSP